MKAKVIIVKKLGGMPPIYTLHWGLRTGYQWVHMDILASVWLGSKEDPPEGVIV